TSVIQWGSIPNAIIKTAAEENCDLIVMGSRTLTGWKRLQVGNVANPVIAKAPQPVMLIKPPQPVSVDRPLRHRILVATGGSAWSDAALDQAFAWASAHGLDVCGLYVSKQRLRSGAAVDPKGEQVLAEAQSKASAAGVRFEPILARGDIANTILATAIDQHCDAIVLGSRGLTGLKRLMAGSIANA
ncbi:MAG: hypothetical protein ETSY2_55020, partial [Candidatus Entotheonella gemina]